MRRLTSEERPCPPRGKRAGKRAAKKPAAKRRASSSRRGLNIPRVRIGRRTILAGSSVLAVALVVGGLGWLWMSGWPERQADAFVAGFHRIAADSGLAVEEVLVEGRERTARSELLDVLTFERGESMLALDLDALRSRLEALPWVRGASVERRLPSLVYLRLEERRPLAIWQLNQQLTVIDEEGAVILGVRPEDFAHLTLVVGEDAPAHSAALLGVLESEPALKERVTAAIWVKGRRWDLRLDNGIDVQLPEGGAAQAWARLARYERRHGVLQRDVAAIDMRLPDRLVVRTLSGLVRPLEALQGKNT